MPRSSNTLTTRAVEVLSARLPKSWRVSRTRSEPPVANYQPDATLEVLAPDGRRAILLVEAKPRLTAQRAADLGPKLHAAAEKAEAAGILLVTPFASQMTRDRLHRAGISYIDLTGNVRVALERPALLIETQGADKDPSPPRRGVKSLKGPKAARIVRALCDWNPPMGVREVARRAGANPGYTTRVLNLLQQEDVIRRDARGQVAEVKWQDLLRRWSEDYRVVQTNRAVTCLAPRGLSAFLSRLENYRGRWTLTGSLAVPPAASAAPARLASCYVDDPERAAEELDLRPIETGANVALLEPFDSVIWDRSREEAGRTFVALTQCVVDLLTGTGREPAEADALLAWMERNEGAWRT